MHSVNVLIIRLHGCAGGKYLIDTAAKHDAKSNGKLGKTIGIIRKTFRR